jgi:hypothetical protein
MTTTIYQKFISRYAETFTLIEMEEGTDYATVEIVPSSRAAKLDEDEFAELVEELRDSRNEKATWSDGEGPFDDEDARSAYHQKWDAINSSLDERGL